MINIIHRAEKEGVWPQGIKKSTKSLEGPEGLNWGGKENLQGISKIMERAETEWHGLWQTGKKHHKRKSTKELPPLTITQLETVLRKLSPDKALGPDHWHPKELLPLSKTVK